MCKETKKPEIYSLSIVMVSHLAKLHERYRTIYFWGLFYYAKHQILLPFSVMHIDNCSSNCMLLTCIQFYCNATFLVDLSFR